MKKHICLGMALVMVLCVVGCSGIAVQSDPARDKLIISIAGRRAGAELAKNHADIATEIKRIAGSTIDGGTVAVVVELLSTAFPDDPMLKADLIDLLSLIPIDPAVEGYVSIAMHVIYAIVDGITLWEDSQ